MAAIWNVDSIRRLILTTQRSIKRSGSSSGSSSSSGIVAETGWIRFGYQRCWRFDCHEFQAVWFLEERSVKFYRNDRTILRVVRLESVPAELNAA